MTRKSKSTFAFALIASFLVPLLPLTTSSAMAIAPMPVMGGMPGSPVAIRSNRTAVPVSRVRRTTHNFPGGVRINPGRHAAKVKPAKKKVVLPPPPPQNLVDSMSQSTLAPGVIHKIHRGAMYINLLDVDLRHSEVLVKPVLAGESFNKLDEVRNQAQRVNAIAAVNGNYFKRDGTPLGTLVIDGEWIAGPLFDRTCLGITDDGRVLVDRVKLHGTLETSNPELKSIWINNVNQPRRHGCKIIAYTRRWGPNVHMDYEGTVVSIDSTGRVVGKHLKSLPVPYGGYVLTDTKASPLAKLSVGDMVNLTWQPGPSDWSRVIHAVSGGPVLIRDGKLFVDCKSENFRKSWTSNTIKARTAVGVTANRHLLLATIEGPHTLWDVAKFLKKLGAVDAMNLDGGGSTTMVIGDKTVTRNPSHFERRVASSIVILPKSAQQAQIGARQHYQPSMNISDFDVQPVAPVNQGNPQQSSAIPDTSKSYELVNIPPSAEEVAGAQADTRDIAGAELEAQSLALKKPKAKKGWMHKLNPLDW